jgi:hypothetical protein
VILHSCWSIDNFCIVVLVLSLLFASKTLLEKCFGKENRKEFGKKRERGKPSLSAWRPSQPLVSPQPAAQLTAQGEQARPTSLPLPPFCG